VRLEIFDAAGRLVRTLVAAELPAGRHRVVWNGLDAKGRRSASGIYFDRLTVDGWRATRKMLLLQ
jgi:flagellar hook assembly protein FlgD